MTKRIAGRMLTLTLFELGMLAPAAWAADNAKPITVEVDISDVGRKIFHSHLEIPVESGPLTLLYPKYIPGEHGPTGPVANVAGLHFTANGKDISWRRDLGDMYTYHLDIPNGVNTLRVDFDFLSPTGAGDFTAGVSVTPSIAALNWNQVLFYPADHNSDALTYEPSLKIPAGWKFATALEVDDRDGNVLEFKPVSLTNLVDSPVLAGRHFREVELSGGGKRKHYLDLIADSEAALDAPDDYLEKFGNLVVQAHKIFGAQHYEHYNFLWTLSDNTAHFGLEHHQSSDDRTEERSLVDPTLRMLTAGLLPHEYVHSWNGKYRRPANLATPEYQTPMKTDMIWVYEGLTSYYGDVLTARSGLWTNDQFRQALAYTAADMDYRPGRTWRPLQDAADDAQVLYGAPWAWSNWRRGVDFYSEGVLLWLAVDTKIRDLSNGSKSLDDFAQRFYGMNDGSYEVSAYTFDDIVANLNAVQSFDWQAFLEDKLDRKEYNAPLDGLQRSGWKLSYTDEPSEYLKGVESNDKLLQLTYSIGLLLNDEGDINDVLWNGPAFKAGLGAGMHLVAVNGREFSGQVLKDAIAAARNNKKAISLLVKNEDMYETYNVDYHGGLRYPALERIDGEPDRLEKIIAAK